jgi:hypothetical protein
MKKYLFVRVVYAGLCAFIFVAILADKTSGQGYLPGDPLQFYLRLLPPDSLSVHEMDTFGGGGFADARNFDTGLHSNLNHPWQHRGMLRTGVNIRNYDVHLIPYAPQFFVSNNSDLPVGGNDGALWQGVGNNVSVSTGFQVKYGAFTLNVRPVFVFSENKEFEVSPIPADELMSAGTRISQFARPLVRADYPQRFGEQSLSRLDTGLSGLYYQHQSWMAGISTKPLWTGPAVYNPLLLSNNAPGFLHFFLGTHEPVQTTEGAVRLRYFWGGLTSSDYYLEDVNARRYITGLSVSFSPRRVPGLELGVNRIAYGDWSGRLQSPAVVLRALQPNPKEPYDNEEGEPDEDFLAMLSLSARWVLPGTGFETYFEWGRNDYRRGLRDLFLEPELNRGYVLGFIKRFDMSARQWLAFNAEMTQLENSSITTLQRPRRVWYEDNHIRGGFTHRGQVLGAAIGPGSSAQTVALSWYHPYGMFGASVGRVVHNNDRLFNFRDFYEALQGENIWNTMRRLHEVSMVYGAKMLVFLPFNMEFQLGVERQSTENLYNVKELDITNIRYELTIRFRPQGWL